MSSSKPGAATSPEVTHIDAAGIWVLVHDREYFLSHKEYPWFEQARVSDILKVELPSVNHLRWPTLDVDVHLESLERPEAYPLIYRN